MTGLGLDIQNADGAAKLLDMAKMGFVYGLYECARILNLERGHEFTYEDALRLYNGTGPEWLPKSVREVLDRYSRSLLPAVLVHDIDYSMGDGTLFDFQRANRRLMRNGVKCADAAYPWWNPMRYIVRRQAKVYAKFCDAFGLESYIEATSRQQKKS